MKKGLLILPFIVLVAIIMTGCSFKKKPPALPLVKASSGISLATVATHNTSDDCWLVVNNNIYNLTDYIYSRSAGENIIVDYCGKEATEIFRSGLGESALPPSGLTTDDLVKYYIGDLARQVECFQDKIKPRFKLNRGFCIDESGCLVGWGADVGQGIGVITGFL